MKMHLQIFDIAARSLNGIQKTYRSACDGYQALLEDTGVDPSDISRSVYYELNRSGANTDGRYGLSDMFVAQRAPEIKTEVPAVDDDYYDDLGNPIHHL